MVLKYYFLERGDDMRQIAKYFSDFKYLEF